MHTAGTKGARERRTTASKGKGIIMKTTRRGFLGAAGGAALTAGLAVGAKAVAANDRIQFAGIGLNSRGWALTRNAYATGLADIAALCDVDKEVLEGRAKEVEDLTGKRPKTYQDVRELYADDGIDAVGIATPNHWHTLCGIWAMQSGKDAYIEKPISHTLFEGRQLVAAAKKYGRVIQHGAQRRSEGTWQRAVERAKSGVIGDIYMARSLICRRREAFWFPPEEAPPAHLAWDLWQGPATDRPFSRNIVHYNWHWFWHYGNAEVGNNGPHGADIVNWIFGKGLPVETYSTGGIFGYDKDARETPNTHVINHTFADGSIYSIEIRNRFTPGRPMVTFFGTEGYAEGQTFHGKDGEVIKDDAPRMGLPDSSRTHMNTFLKAVRAQDPDAVAATPEQGHVAAALCHLGNIAYRLKRPVRLNPETEQFDGDEEANALLTRVYREGFEVPKIV